jgi:hypothetical protein
LTLFLAITTSVLLIVLIALTAWYMLRPVNNNFNYTRMMYRNHRMLLY